MLKYSFRKHKLLSLRLWHWLNAAVIVGLLGTVLLRKTLLSWRMNSALIEAKLKGAGTAITPELAKEIAVAIRDPLWDWHIYLGFALGVLFVGRVLIAIFVEKKWPGLEGLTTFWEAKGLPAGERAGAFHYAAVKIGYAVFYLATALMVTTGFVLIFKAEIGLSKDLAGLAKEVHELMMWFFVVFVGGHLLGVLAAENNNDPGLISDMVHGGDAKGE